MLQETQLTYRMVLHISLPQLTPLIIVPLPFRGLTVILLVLSHVLEFVLPAELPICQLWASRMLARLHRFSWHVNHSNRKATVDFSAVAFVR